jgi:hypothetical protein
MFPALFIGGTWPFSLVLLAAFLTQVGALQTAPILIAVITAYLTIEPVRYLLARRKAASRQTAARATGGGTS